MSRNVFRGSHNSNPPQAVVRLKVLQNVSQIFTKHKNFLHTNNRRAIKKEEFFFFVLAVGYLFPLFYMQLNENGTRRSDCLWRMSTHVCVHHHRKVVFEGIFDRVHVFVVAAEEKRTPSPLKLYANDNECMMWILNYCTIEFRMICFLQRLRMMYIPGMKRERMCIQKYKTNYCENELAFSR